MAQLGESREQAMRCWQCGKPLREDEGICPWCGATQEGSAQAATAPSRSGVPVEAYTPSRHGPPSARDSDAPPSAGRTRPMEAEAQGIIRRLGYHPVILPPPAHDRASRRWHFSRSALAVLALFAVLGLAAGVVARGGNVPIPGLAAMQQRPTVAATAALVCKPAPVAHTTAPMLGSLQLTTGLKNLAKQDYRPVDNVTRFTLGQTGYVTFRVLSSQAGTADMLVCMPGHRFTGHPVQVPKGSAGLYVEYPLSFGSADVGQGMVTISWDGSVAANQEFTVVR